MEGSIPSANVDILPSGSMEGPVTRSTITMLSRTDYGAMGGTRPHAGFIDLQNNPGNHDNAHAAAMYDSRSTASLAASMNVNHIMPYIQATDNTRNIQRVQGHTGRLQNPLQESSQRPSQSHTDNIQSPVQESSQRPTQGHTDNIQSPVQESSQRPSQAQGHPDLTQNPLQEASQHTSQGHHQDHTAPDVRFPPTDSYNQTEHVQNWLQNHQNPGSMATTSTARGRLVTDAVPYQPDSMEVNYGAQSRSTIAEAQTTVLEGPPVKSKTEEKSAADKMVQGDFKTQRLESAQEPGYIRITGANGQMNINMRNTNTVQIGNNNVMTVIQQPAGANMVHVSRGAAHHVKTKPKRKVTLQVPKRLVSDLDMEVVADHIGRDWRRLGTRLTLTSGELESLDHDFQRDGLREVVFQMVRRWKSNLGPEATIRSLTKALVDIKRADIAKKFTE